MTGRDLIIYIMANGLEDKPIFENGKLLGYMTIDEAAVKFEVGTATIRAWVNNDILDGIKIGKEIYIPITSVRPSYTHYNAQLVKQMYNPKGGN